MLSKGAVGLSLTDFQNAGHVRQIEVNRVAPGGFKSLIKHRQEM